MMAAVEAIKRAVRSGDLDALEEQKLQEMNVSVNNGLGNDDFTPLHWACYYGQAEVLQYFLNLGADMSLLTKQGWNGAHVCSIRGCTNCLKILCNNGIDLTEVDARGYTCAHLAAAHGKCSTLQAILKSGVDISTWDNRLWSVSHHAAFHGRLGVLEFVAKMEIDMISEDKDGNTPSHLAASEGHLDCLDFLVNNQPELSPLDVISCRNNDGATPKDLATKFQRKDCVDFLSSIDQDETIGDEKSNFPAHAAVERGDLAALKKLIQSGSHDINDQDDVGDTLAHKAAASGDCLCLQWLIDHGADVTLKNNEGETPRSLAIRFARVGCISILAANGYGAECSEGEDDEDKPRMLASAQEKLEELQKLLDTAKARFRQLGGELPEDGTPRRRNSDHKHQVAELQKKLEHERERREALESELDKMRKKLHHKLSRNKSMSSHSPTEVTEDERERIKRLKRRLSKKKYSTGGAFIRIDHI